MDNLPSRRRFMQWTPCRRARSRCRLAGFCVGLAFAAGCAPNPTGVAYPADFTAPRVSIVGITDGQRLTAPMAIAVRASDDDSPVTEVRIYLDGVEAVSAGFDSYSAELTYTLAAGADHAGAHSIVVQARDAAGNLADAAVAYTVASP